MLIDKFMDNEGKNFDKLIKTMDYALRALKEWWAPLGQIGMARPNSAEKQKILEILSNMQEPNVYPEIQAISTQILNAMRIILR